MKNVIKIVPVILFSPFACVTDLGKEPSQFGFHYDLLQTSTLPLLTPDSLFVRVAYSACIGNHGFHLQYRVVAPSTSELWLLKQTADQPCNGYFQETKSFLLPHEVRASEGITLLGPGEKKITLRGPPEDSDLPVGRLATHAIKSITISGSTVRFQLVCGVPEAGCWRYLKTDYTVDGNTYLITIHGQRKSTDPCLQVYGSMDVTCSITVAGPGTYDFKFWQFDTTKDTTITVP